MYWKGTTQLIYWKGSIYFQTVPYKVLSFQTDQNSRSSKSIMQDCKLNCCCLIWREACSYIIR